MPALVNAHDHGRAVRTSSIGAAGKPLEAWLHYLALFPSVDPYLAALVSLARSAQGGAGTVMMHYTRAQGFTDLPQEAKDVARAAKDVGVRVGFAVSMKDRNPLVYGPSEPILAALPAEARARDRRTVPAGAAAAGRTRRARRCGGGRRRESDVRCPVRAERRAMVQRCVAAVPWQMPRSGRDGASTCIFWRRAISGRGWIEAYPGGVVKHLDAIGLLSPRLTLAHCVWARPDELELLAERGVTIAVNNSSNLHLQFGSRVHCIHAPLRLPGRARHRRPMRSMTTTMRCGRCGSPSCCIRAPASGPTSSRSQVLRMAFETGRRSVTNVDEGGAVEPGMPADLLVLDWDALDDDRLRDDIDPLRYCSPGRPPGM